jgi:hypothetical protein
MIRAILAGLLGVTNMIIRWVYGDLAAEKFALHKVLRSLFLGAVWWVTLFLYDPSLAWWVISMVVIWFERLMTEIYKGFFRIENQSKYIIPSHLGMWVSMRRPLLWVIIIALFIWLFLLLDWEVHRLLVSLLVWLSVAFGGAWKDAPYEGFDYIKFWRSPVVAIVCWYLFFLSFWSTWLNIMILWIAGCERVISECWKKIINGNIPWKFKKELISQEWINKRRWLLIPYIVTIILFVWLFLLPHL